jgi:hypothetical protein
MGQLGISCVAGTASAACPSGGSSQPLAVVRTGVRHGPEPPETQHLLELVKVLWASCAVHGCGILGPELCVVLLGEGAQDLDWVIGIAVVCGVRSH